MPSEKLLKTSQTMSLDGVATLLETLAGRIREGRVDLSVGTENVSLDLPANVKVDVEVTREPKRRRGPKLELEIEIEWREGDTAGPGQLRIG
ncbi:hypothetical protein GOHSU_02_01270 [Gordonia hirsuta DSM 44140 = NBRC 16056]|uniref:Amphi-Trp domain-containing protein n=1 Tax=Gordonia hirsuta DSM 44140 = NBRC 16056 TaxID=1121927 RepID=L7L7K5_9ACTN|nr:amphi-Trp domain-containing protein [Gordonia hirsuta]GAC55983.1 hypothetical protein GOHSU_02_01270 [Gordonia hirsuta DSM 44140 = NBRC 16056]